MSFTVANKVQAKIHDLHYINLFHLKYKLSFSKKIYFGSTASQLTH